MAQSRLERIGTIFSRTTSLIQGGAMKMEDRPLWYLIYQAFPPKVEPRFDRPTPTTPIRQILYKEDIVRAKFQQENRSFLASSLVHKKSKSRTQRFISIYQELEKRGLSGEELYTKAMDEYVGMSDSLSPQAEHNERGSSAPGKKLDTTVDLQNIFTN